MAKHLFNFGGLLEVALLLEFLKICMSVPASHGQQGFLSIDCGSFQDNYINDIGLSWINDDKYISTGRNSRPFEFDSPSYFGNGYPGYNYVYGDHNYSAWGDFRYFPEQRSKHCYDLPTRSNISYLIRASFLCLNESDFEVLQPPIKFYVFVNSTNVFTVKFNHDDYGQAFGRMYEGIFYSPGSIIHFCLQPVTGVPFISSLELRPLDPEGIMYSYTGSKRKYLSLWYRFNLGDRTTSVRFPEDPFDRLWFPDNYNYSLGYPYINNTSPSLLNANTSAKMNNIPIKVMQDGLPIVFLSSLSLDLLDFPVDYVYVALYFQELNASKSRGVINMSIDDGEKVIYTSSPFNVTSSPSVHVIPTLDLGTRGINIYLEQLSNLTDTLIVTAAEIYYQNTFQNFITRQFEEEIIKLLKTSFNLTNWQGDPCSPVPYDWLTCEYWTAGWRVDTVTLSNLRSIGWPLFIDKYNDVFNKTNESTLSLNGMSLTHSDIDDATFQFLVEKFIGYLPWNMDFSYNQISILPPTIYNRDVHNSIYYLNLNHNNLSGQLSSFGDMILATEVQFLNLSYNNITSLGLPFDWEFSGTTFLKILDLSHNKLEGDISSLNRMMGGLWENLGQLNISGNNLTGRFPSEVYFSNLTNLFIGTFDGNQIEETLDLRAWHESLQQVMNTSKVSTIDQIHISRVFSFVNNNIKDINPSIEVLEMTITFFLENYSNFNKTGILLGGNPYCKGAKSQIHRYLCRYTINDIYIFPEKKNNKPILISGIIGGVFLLLLCCVLLATVWYLRNKVSTLRQIQQVLAEQKVQPPFYSYNDLKHATRNFHKDNKLGSGAFGVVYKGVLADGTTLAVKKLFNSQQVQVLNEFLNEVVLITGIKHKNLVQLKGCSVNDKQRILVYEYVENGNLAEVLWPRDKQALGTSILDWQQRFKICVGIARGLSYLHEELQPRIIHRDIKPANILLDKNFNPKIGDFGLAKHYLNEQSQAQFTNVAGTRGYFAPEYANQGKLTDKADVFSFGILVMEIVSGRKVIDYNVPSERMYLKDWAQQLHHDGMLLELLQPELRQNFPESEVIRVINIALMCVQIHPERRATMSQVVTMLMGNMDVTIFLNKHNYYQPNFNNLLSINGHLNTSKSTLHNNCEAINEESDKSHLLQENVELALPFNSIGCSSNATIELSGMIGR